MALDTDPYIIGKVKPKDWVLFFNDTKGYPYSPLITIFDGFTDELDPSQKIRVYPGSEKNKPYYFIGKDSAFLNLPCPFGNSTLPRTTLIVKPEITIITAQVPKPDIEDITHSLKPSEGITTIVAHRVYVGQDNVIKALEQDPKLHGYGSWVKHNLRK